MPCQSSCIRVNAAMREPFRIQRGTGAALRVKHLPMVIVQARRVACGPLCPFPLANEPLCAGVQLGGQLEDPQLAAELLWPNAAEDDPGKLSLTRLQSSVAPSFKVGYFRCSWGVCGLWGSPGLLKTRLLLVCWCTYLVASDCLAFHVAGVGLPSWALTGLHRATIPWRMLPCVW